jgi:hypothetical protein
MSNSQFLKVYTYKNTMRLKGYVWKQFREFCVERSFISL